jgi:hypothetical protein
MTGRSKPSWSDVKDKLADFDRPGLLGLVQDLYVASKDNQAFLHARLNLGEDVLKPYKETIDRWLWPDVFKNQDTSVAKAKKAITDYKKASGTADGLAELMVFYCERASGFSCRCRPRRRSLLVGAGANVRAGAEGSRTLPEDAAPGTLHAPADGSRAQPRHRLRRG